MKLLLPTLCLLAFARPAHAASDCRLYDTIARIHTATTLAVNNPDTAIMTVNVKRLRAELSFLDMASVRQNLQGRVARRDANNILEVIDFAATLVISAEVSTDMLLDQLSGQHNSGLLEQAKGAINTLVCASETNVVSNTSAASSPRSSDNTPLGASEIGVLKKLTFKTGFTAFLIAGGGLGAVLGGRYAWRWAQSKRRRKAKRFNVTLPITFSPGAINYAGMLCDISRVGCRFAHKDELTATAKPNIKLLIDERWIEGKVMWGNDEFCGVQFNRMLERSDVTKIRRAALRFLRKHNMHAPGTHKPT